MAIGEDACDERLHIHAGKPPESGTEPGGSGSPGGGQSGQCRPVSHRRRDARHAGWLPHPRLGFCRGRERAETGPGDRRGNWRGADRRRRTPQVRRDGVCGRCYRPGGQRQAGAGGPPRRPCADRGGYHSGGSARPRFHLQRHRPVAQSRLAGLAAGSFERPGRPAAP